MSLSFSNIKSELGVSDRITFGKYDGAYLQDVIDADPRYVLWLLANTSTRISREAQKNLSIALIEKLDILTSEVKSKKKIPALELEWKEDGIPF